MSLNIGSIDFDEQWLFKEFTRDARDDWFPDPLRFDDMLDAKFVDELYTGNLDRNSGKYSPSRRDVFNLPKANFTLSRLRKKSHELTP